MRLLRCLLALVTVLSGVALVRPTPVAAETTTATLLTDTVYELRKPTNGWPMLTAKATEVTKFASQGYTQRIALFNASIRPQPGLVPAWRLFRSSDGNCFVTIYATERDNAVRYHGYVSQGIAFYVAATAKPDLLPVYRFHTPKWRLRFAATPQRQATLLNSGYVKEPSPRFYAAAPLTPAQAVAAMPSYTPEILNAMGSHNAFPGAVRLANGYLLAAYRVAANHFPGISGGQVYSSWSRDNGATWTVPRLVEVPTTMPVGVGGLSVPSRGPLSGRPILTIDERDANGLRAKPRIMVANDDMGLSWGPYQSLTLDGPGTQSVLGSRAIQLSDTKFLIASYNGSGDARTRQITWNGSGWTMGTIALLADGVGNQATPSYAEPNVVAWKDAAGRTQLMALLRTNSWGTNSLYIRQSYSHDLGVTWTKPTNAFPGEGNPHMTMLADGRIMVVYRHFVGATRTAGELWPAYVISGDKGATWSAEVKIGDARSMMAYGDPVEYAPGNVTVVWAQEDSVATSNIRIYVTNLLDV